MQHPFLSLLIHSDPLSVSTVLILLGVDSRDSCLLDPASGDCAVRRLEECTVVISVGFAARDAALARRFRSRAAASSARRNDESWSAVAPLVFAFFSISRSSSNYC